MIEGEFGDSRAIVFLIGLFRIEIGDAPNGVVATWKRENTSAVGDRRQSRQGYSVLISIDTTDFRSTVLL